MTATPCVSFEITNDGVFAVLDNKLKWISAPLQAIALTCSSQTGEWGMLLEFRDRDGQVRRWTMPLDLLASNGQEVRRQLLSYGLLIYRPGPRSDDLLLEYLHHQEPNERLRLVSCPGWHDGAFVLPEIVINPPNKSSKIGLSLHENPPIRSRGTMEQWSKHLGEICQGNRLLTFAVSVAFAPPLLHLVEEESGGFHFVGESSTGKTTLARLAGSIWGGGGVNGYLSQWRATPNAMEGLALSRCDSLLVLDELNQVDPAKAGECAYLLSNQAGKARSDRRGQLRTPATWRLLFLSTGEVGLASYVNDSGRLAKAGQQVRMIDIPADAGFGTGVFDNLHSFTSGDALSRAIANWTTTYHGTPIVRFLECLVRDKENAVKSVKQNRKNFLAEVVPSNSCGQVSRVASRFSLIAGAGELAVAFGILPLPEGSVTQAVGACFRSWLDQCGADGGIEKRQALRQVEGFFQNFGSSRFQAVVIDPNGDSYVNDTSPSNRVGFRIRHEEGGETEWYVFRQAFETIICKGLNPRFVSRVLSEIGQGIPTNPKRIGKTAQRRYMRFTDGILGDDSTP